ncbi:MAG: helix-turn-helix domain-containing protein [Anaerolineae bacterium]
MKQGTKYYPLYEYLKEASGHEGAIELTFDRIEAILEARLPASARKSRSWWANSASSNRVQAAAWMEAGYHVDTIDLKQEQVLFARPERLYHLVVDRSKMDWNAGTIRALRQHMGLTQQELANQLNMRQQTISEWETGMYKPRGGSVALLNLVAERAGFYDALMEEREDASNEP